MMIFSLFGAIDANLKALVGQCVSPSVPILSFVTEDDTRPLHADESSEPLVQSSPAASNVFICMSFFVALFNYIRFAREIIWQM